MCHLFVFILLFLLQVGVSSSSEEGDCDARRKAMVISKGKEMAIEESSNFERKTWGKDGYYHVLEESKPVLYVFDFLNATTADELKSFCKDRFVHSPVRGKLDTDDNVSQDEKIRTSESCAMVPAYMYLSNPAFQELRKQPNPDPSKAKIFREVDVTWEVTQRAASLLSWDATTVEPLQLVRYTSPNAYYQTHHDHGGFYGKTMEIRPWTVLVFLNDVLKGGHTHFPKLDLRVAPRAGDAIAWSNVAADGAADPDMVHAGEPPGEEGIVKYAVNIWFGESSLSRDSAARASGTWSKKE